jgi:fibronectin-binding autotransporter adhesin
MKTPILYSCLFFFLFFHSKTHAQSTSWKGTASTSWSSSSNWTNGIPSSTLDVIIGDANFTGSFQPTISSTATAKSITIGNAAKVSTLTVSRGLTVSGDILIGTNGTISNGAYTITLTGNWTKNGSYTTSSSSARVTFAGTTQSINASGSTQTFRRLTINSGSTVTTNVAFAVTGTSALMTVTGTFNPSTFLISGTGGLTVSSGGTLHVKGATFAASYSLSGSITLSAGNIVNYSNMGDQTVSNSFTYSTLRISGSGTKSLTGNLPALRAGASTQGNIYVEAGTFDLSSFTAARGILISGGTFSVSNGATLKIGGTNTFPANYTTRSFGLSSTVEYSGGAGTQTISLQSYGNLTFSSASGAAIKTLPGSAMVIAGNYTSNVGNGTSVAVTAFAALTISGNITIGTNTSFNASSFSHIVGGNFTANGTFTGSTSTITLTGPSTAVSGSSTPNFNNLTITASGITSTAAALSIAGNLTTSGAGTFTHSPSGTLTMSGASKVISGTGIIFDNLTISGTVTTSSTYIVTGNLSVGGSLACSAGTVSMTGASKTITGTGTKTFNALAISGSVTTAVNFIIGSGLDVSGTFSASTSSVATFTGSSTLNGTANLFSVVINGTELKLSTNAILGIANTLTLTLGTLNVTSTTPNTVNFNGTGAQNINGITYHNLSVSNGNTKTASSAITVNGELNIGSSTTFGASSFTHTVYGNWVNSGTFTAGTSTVQFLGAANTTLTGATTFNILIVNKSNTAAGITLVNNVTTPTLTMTQGWMSTGSNTVNITSTRSGPGIIYGNIQRTQSFTGGVAYEFEGQANTIIFSGANSVTSVTVSVTLEAISDFPFNGSISRVYNIALGGSLGAAIATLRLHYEDNELNGNSESTMQLWHYNGSVWAVSGKSGVNTSTNYVEQSLLSNITNRWTLSDDANVVRWTGTNSTLWSDAGNWSVFQGSATAPPSSGDIVQFGITSPANQPTINAAAGVAGAVTVKNIVFGSAAPITLTMASGTSLTTNAINGVWSGNAAHNINVGAQTLTVNGDLSLSDGTTNHTIGLAIGSGTVAVTGSLTESGGANITFSGAGNLTVGNNFTYVSGTFTPSTGTVTYNGTLPQTIAGITYNNLTINKTSGIATKSNTGTINGNLTVTAGELDVNIATLISGNVSIASGAIMNGDGITTSVGGNWSNSGTFVSATGTIELNGTGSQSVSVSTFNNLTINKASGTATLTGNIAVNGNITISSGTFDMASFSANRGLLGGVFSMTNGTSLLLAGSNHFPSNFSNYNMGTTSTVTYNGTGVQTVAGVTYGNLILSNGGANAKTLGGSAGVNGDITINNGATFDGSTFTITLAGNWNNNGTYTPSTSTIVFTGTSKTINGNTTFNRMTISGTYTVNNNDIIIDGRFFVVSGGSYQAGSGTHTVNGDLTNSGSLTSIGITTFSGAQTQTIQLLNAIVSNSAGVINFNGSVSPILNSNTMPTYATVNINNTGGITASVDWKVVIAMNIGTGATFNAGAFNDTISGSFTNSGTVTSSGTMFFNPTLAPVSLALGTTLTSTGTLRFGGTSAITITGTPAAINDLIISNTNAAGISPPSGWSIGGTFTIRSNSIFNAGSFSYSVAGNIESNGTLNGGTSTFTVSSATGELSGSGSTTFNNFIITGNLVANSDFNVSGNFTNNGTYDGSIGTMIMTGTGASVIAASSSPSTLAQIQNAKTNATTTLGVNITNVADLDIVSGTFSTAAFTITQSTGGILTVNDDATLQIGGTNSLPAFDTYQIDTLSTITYNGTGTQAITIISYGNLSLAGSSTKTVSAGLTVLNDFSLSAGIFTGGSFTHTIKNNWIMTGGTFTNTGTIILLNGTTAQTIKSTGAFNDLTINKASGSIYDSTDVTVNGTLTLTSGNIITGSNKHIIGATGSVSRTSGHIIGNLQKNVAIGATSRTFEIGDASGYAPVIIAFGNVTVAGNLIATTASGDHSDIANSQISATKSVNRTWTYTNSGITFTTYTITLNFLPGDIDVGATTANFYVANKSGSTWILPTIGTRTSTSTQATGLSTFGDFIVGEIGARQWDGGAGTNSWSDANNWDPNGVPVSTEDAWIKTAATVQISSAVTINSFLMDNTSATTTLQSGGSLIINGVVTLTSGEFLMNGQTLTLNGTFATGAGTIRGTSGSTLNIGGTSGGDLGTIRMTASSPNNLVQNITLNRTGANGAATIGANGIEVTGTVTLTSGILNTGGNLTLISSDLTNTARIAKIESAAAISGNVTVQRFIPAGTVRRHQFWGSPVSNFTFAQLIDDIYITGPGGTANGFDSTQTQNPSAFLYTESITGVPDNGWVNPSSVNEIIPTGTGLRVYYRGNRSQGRVILESNPPAPIATVLDYTGSVNTGNILLPVTCSNGCGTEDGWNLVANAYPSPIDWNAASGWTKTNISPSIYIYNPIINAYAVWDGSVGTNNASRHIPIGQSFFVKATGAPTLSMTEDVKVSTLPATQLFKTDALEYMRIRMIKDSSSTDETVIKFSTNAIKEYYSNEDALKLQNPIVGIASISSEGVSLAINNYPGFVKKDTIKLNVYASESGNYRLHFSEFYNISANKTFVLKDAYLQTEKVINANSIYDFTVTANNSSQGKDRFSLIFKSNAVSVHNISGESFKNSPLTIYPVPAKDEVYISNIPATGTGKLSVVDVVGQVIFTQTIINKDASDIIPVSITEFTPGVYFVEITELTVEPLRGKFIKQ